MKKKPQPKRFRWMWLIIVAILIVASFGIMKLSNGSSMSQMLSRIIPTSATTTISMVMTTSTPPVPPPTIHVPLPQEVRAIYWTAQTAGIDRHKELLDYMLKHGLNAVVIDAKMDNGEIAFEPKNESLKPYAQNKPGIKDLDALMKELADNNIYRIARIAIMKDSSFAAVTPGSALRTAGGGVWRDKTGVAWLDPASPDVRKVAIALGKECFDHGFDEVQFDYVRFPSDGVTSAIQYPFFGKNTSTKAEVMAGFFKDVSEPLRSEKIPVSFDLFGMTFLTTYDMDIGQRLQDAYAYSDFVSPMVYPSHYPSGFKGFKNPADHPYEVIKISLDEGAKIMETIGHVSSTEMRPHVRPWIQDFDIGAVYTAPLIEAQIKAVRDGGASGFLIWNARNVYEPANYTTSTEN